jgi:hypothetical protein
MIIKVEDFSEKSASLGISYYDHVSSIYRYGSHFRAGVVRQSGPDEPTGIRVWSVHPAITDAQRAEPEAFWCVWNDVIAFHGLQKDWGEIENGCALKLSFDSVTHPQAHDILIIGRDCVVYVMNDNGATIDRIRA